MGFLSLFDFFAETFWIWIIGLLFLVGVQRVKVFSRRFRYSKTEEGAKCESPIEEMLMSSLMEKGYDVYAQEPCGRYRIDLSIHNRGRKIAIECDGEAYHSSPEQLAHDRKKDKFLRKHRWIVLRFSGSEIYRNRERCVHTIERHLMTKKDRKKLRKSRIA